MSQHCVGVFPARVFTICRSSMRAFTPASISFLSWGVSGHGYKVALNLKIWRMKKHRLESVVHLIQLSKCCPVTYPSQIFLTLFFSWSPWKKMMKTDLWTWSPCGKITVRTATGTTSEQHHRKTVQFSTQFNVRQDSFKLFKLYWLWSGLPEDLQCRPASGTHFLGRLSTASSRMWEYVPC